MLFFETERLFLRMFNCDDAPTIRELLNNEDLAKTTLKIPHPYPEGFAEQWIVSSLDKAKKGSSFTMAIVLKGTLEIVGSVTLNVALNHKRGELAYWIGRPYWDNGYATEAAKKMIQYGFLDLKLNRIWASVMKKNIASIEVMKKSGLYYEGTFLQHVFKWGKFEDVEYYGIVREKYTEIEEHCTFIQI